MSRRTLAQWAYGLMCVVLWNVMEWTPGTKGYVLFGVATLIGCIFSDLISGVRHE
jgi:hypothetical protein